MPVFEYTKVLNMPMVLNIIWLWIHQGSEYASGLNVLGLHRVLNMPEFVWIISGYAWICIPEYAWICLNLHEWVLFYVSSFSFLINVNGWLLLTSTFTWNFKSWRKDNSWRDTIWFFLQQLEVFDLFFLSG